VIKAIMQKIDKVWMVQCTTVNRKFSLKDAGL
jgi:hypothetical protein